MESNFSDNTLKFISATTAFEYLFDKVMAQGIFKSNTKALLNTSFTLLYPEDNEIRTLWRKWQKSYAELEWKWYLSKDRNPKMVAERAQLWLSMQNENGDVNSNYGWQWNRNGQIDYVISELRRDPSSRRAVITIYDGKENLEYKKDTPCTCTIHFYYDNLKLCMTVHMRSNDLVYGFCNDQYCFSKLQIMVAKKLSVRVGYYHHIANDLHIYEKHFNLKK